MCRSRVRPGLGTHERRMSMVLKNILTAATSIGAGFIGYNAANAFKGNPKYAITKVLVTLGAFGIADAVSTKVNEHIDKELDEIIKDCRNILNKEDENDGEEATVIDISPEERDKT